MKKCYILKHGDLILGVYSNLKGAYRHIIYLSDEIEKEYLKSYPQVNRYMKDGKYFGIPTKWGKKMEILQEELRRRFSIEKK